MAERLRSSLSPLEGIWKVSNSFSFAPYVMKGVDYMSGTLGSSLPLEDIWKLIKEKVGDFSSSTWEGVNAIAPYVKKGFVYLVEMVQQHPDLACSIAALLFSVFLCKCCYGSGGWPGGKMMKAPGADYMMRRAAFESSPKSYFRRLRGKECF